ncbi:hypothetical protein BD779DRAFT_1491942 [Infundibulicybe gibba]|nr:hypothetical protein BD779DRAFT_1491942 [Infundibulicybe gibba]
MSDNPSFVLQDIEKVAYEQRPIPQISDDDVLIEVKKTGICGSDVHFLVEGRIGDFIVKSPMASSWNASGQVLVFYPAARHERKYRTRSSWERWRERLSPFHRHRNRPLVRSSRSLLNFFP